MSNRPDWCPADVWNAVEEMSRPNESDPTMRKVQGFAARCVMAERERCIKAIKDSITLHYMSIGTAESAIGKIMGGVK